MAGLYNWYCVVLIAGGSDYTAAFLTPQLVQTHYKNSAKSETKFNPLRYPSLVCARINFSSFLVIFSNHLATMITRS